MSATPLAIGLALVAPPAVRGTKARVVEIEEMTARAEGLGLDAAWVYGRALAPLPAPEPLQTVAALARQHARLRFGTLGVDVALQHPTLLARRVATADIFAGGRLDLGIAIDDDPAAYAALEIPFDEREARTDEALDALTCLWQSEESVIFEGQYNRFYGITAPRPVQAPYPPIPVAGRGEATLARVARHAQGWIAPLGADVAEVEAGARPLAAQWQAAGREGTPRVVAQLAVNVDPGYAAYEAREYWQAYAHLAESSPFDTLAAASAFGEPGACLEHVRALRAAGITDLILHLFSDDWRTHLERVNRLVVRTLRDDA